jgi:FdhD protein
VVTVTLARPPAHEPSARYGGVSAGASACGVCGAESIDDVLALEQVASCSRWQDLRLDPALVRRLPEDMRSRQKVFDSTGGLHAAGLFTADGELLLTREDVGRHNAVDKVVGARLLAGDSPAEAVLCVSGRIGFEIVQKAVAAGVGVLVAVGAPSSLAVALAERAGLCTVGFAGPDRFVTYACPERVGV